MAEGIDFGKFAQTAIAFQNLQETMRRNDISAQGLTLEQGRLEAQRKQNELEGVRLKQTAAIKAYDELDKLKDSPAFAGDKFKQAQLLVTQGQIMRDGLGIKDLPIPTDVNDALGGFEQYKNLYKSLSSDDPAVQDAAAVEFAVANPKQFRLIMDDKKRAGELTPHLQQLRTIVALNEEKLDVLKQKKAAAEIQDNLYGLHFAELRAPISMVRDKEIEPHLRKLQGMDEAARTAYLRMYPEVAQKLERVQSTFADATLSSVMSLRADLSARQFALEKEQGQNGTARQELVDEVGAYQTTLKAREAQYEWLKDEQSFFDPAKYKKVLAEEQQLRLAQGKPKAIMAGIAEERLKLSQTLRDDKLAKAEFDKQKDFAQQRAQEVYLQRLKAGDDDLTAGVAAAQTVRDEFKGVPVDLTKLENPAKKGKMEATLNINEPTKAVVTDIQKELLGIEKTKNIIDNLVGTIEQGNIGFAAALKSTAYGFSAQIQSLAEMAGEQAAAAKHKNFTPSKWFDPKISTVDLLANTLAYRLINQEQGGRVSDKDLAEMRDRLNIKSWLAGKEDAITRLKEIRKQIEFEESVNRRVVDKFGKAPEQAQSAPATAADYLKLRGIGVGQ